MYGEDAISFCGVIVCLRGDFCGTGRVLSGEDLQGTVKDKPGLRVEVL